MLEENPAPAGKESLFSDINDESQLGIGSTDKEKQRIIDAAIGNSKESFDDIMKDFNKRWSEATEKVSQKIGWSPASRERRNKSLTLSAFDLEEEYV